MIIDLSKHSKLLDVGFNLNILHNAFHVGLIIMMIDLIESYELHLHMHACLYVISFPFYLEQTLQ